MENKATKSRAPEYPRQYIEHECYSSKLGTKPRPDVRLDYTGMLTPTTFRTAFALTAPAAVMYLETEGYFRKEDGWYYMQPLTRELFPVWFVCNTTLPTT